MPKNKKSVLIIEDDQFLAKMLEQMIKSKGYRAEKASSGKEGLNKFLHHKYDLILLDIILPDIDGFELLEKIRKNKSTKETPILILSNLGQEEDINQGLRLGANDYIIKSDFSLDEVLSKIKKYV